MGSLDKKVNFRWDGTTDFDFSGWTTTPPSDSIDLGTWGDSLYTWGDVSLILELHRGGSRRRGVLRDPRKKKQLIRLICRVKGELVYDESKPIEDIHIRVEDINLVINEVLGAMRVENTNVI